MKHPMNVPKPGIMSFRFEIPAIRRRLAGAFTVTAWMDKIVDFFQFFIRHGSGCHVDVGNVMKRGGVWRHVEVHHVPQREVRGTFWGLGHRPGSGRRLSLSRGFHWARLLLKAR